MNGHGAKNLVRLALAGLCALLLASFAAQAFSHAVVARKADRALTLVARMEPVQEGSVVPRDLSAYSGLTKAPLFGPTEAPPPPPPGLGGIMGQYAVLDGQLHAAGANVNGWQIVRVDSDAVVVSREGREQTLRPYQSRTDLVLDNRQDRGGAGGRGGSGPPAGRSGSGAGDDGRAGETAERGARRGRGMPAPPAGMAPGAFSDIAQSVRDGTASPEEIEQRLRERFGGELPPNMDPDMIRRFSERQGGRGRR